MALCRHTEHTFTSAAVFCSSGGVILYGQIIEITENLIIQNSVSLLLISPFLMNKHRESKRGWYLMVVGINRIWSKLCWCKPSIWDNSGMTSKSLFLPSVFCLCGSDLHHWKERGSTSIWK